MMSKSEVESPRKEEVIPRTEKGTFPKGVSGNPAGRPVGSKNKITLLKQELELMLREQAKPRVGDVLEKAIELALEGNPAMIKLLLELHMSKGIAEEAKAADRVAIQINSGPGPSEVKKAGTTTIDHEPAEESD